MVITKSLPSHTHLPFHPFIDLLFNPLFQHFLILIISPFSSPRYPFHGAEHSGLFAKIRRGQFSLPDSLSSRAKCLIKCLLRKEPSERINTEDVLVHPWLVGSHRERGGGTRKSPHSDSGDQAVPTFVPSLPDEARRGPLYLSQPRGTNTSLSESSLAQPSGDSEQYNVSSSG